MHPVPVAPSPQQHQQPDRGREPHLGGGGHEPRPDGGTPARPRIPRPRAPQAPHSVAWTLSQQASEAGRARHVTARQLTAWGLGQVVPVVEMITSELVANAVRHGAPPIRLTLTLPRGRHLRCEVFDTGRGLPSLQQADKDDEHGRGLCLVARLALAWGVTLKRAGRTVWTDVFLPGATADGWRSS
ncbi:ATP-binding protein [Streptomyces violascens]|uniref:ATP-binding protein n=1 Tax=Streptomyces violascens TaxID=67381 RepID=UPI0037BB9131